MEESTLLPKIFRFNLLPNKSKAEIEFVKERDDSLFYAVTVVVGASIVWFATALILSLLIKPAITRSDREFQSVKTDIGQYQVVQAKHGELVTKTKTLNPLLDKRIDTDLIFVITEDLVQAVPKGRISSYKREASGAFVFNVVTPDYESVAKILDNASLLEGKQISKLELRSTIVDAVSNLVISTIAFNINGIERTKSTN